MKSSCKFHMVEFDVILGFSWRAKNGLITECEKMVYLRESRSHCICHSWGWGISSRIVGYHKVYHVVIVLFDVILIYSSMGREHAQYLKTSLQILRDHILYIKFLRETFNWKRWIFLVTLFWVHEFLLILSRLNYSWE